MTTVRKIQMAANVGDPDDSLSLRIDVVAAAMRVLEAHEAVKGKTDWEREDDCDTAIADLLRRTRRYRSAVQKRRES